MATNDVSAGSSRLTYQGDSETPMVHLRYNRLNTAATNQGSGDTAQVLDVSAGMLVALLALKIVTAEGGTLTVDGGDGTDPDGFLDGVDGNAVAATMYVSRSINPYGMLDGPLYTAADTLDILFNNAADAGIFDLRALVIDLYP